MKNQEINAQRRLYELQREVTVLGEPVRIDGRHSTVWLALGIVIAPLFVMMYLDTKRTDALVFATLTAIGVLLAAMMRIAKFGQPLLIVSREGVQPAGYGFLPWSAISGIEYRANEGKRARGTVLLLYVPGLKAHLPSAHPFIRFFRAIPGIRAARYIDIITIRMRKPSELPWVIERLCRNVWKDATGYTHAWSLDLSGLEIRSTRTAAGTDTKSLERYAKLVDDEHLTRETWARVWTVPGAFALALLIGQVPFGRLVAFVPTGAWSTQAFAMAAVVVIIAWILVIRHARNVFGESFSRTRLIQVIATLGITSILVLPMTWFLITDVGGALANNGNGPNEEITVIATKKERTTRRGCSYVLTHPALGKRMCLVRAQFLTFPAQVPVVLSIRRNALGYKVFEQRIALPGH